MLLERGAELAAVRQALRAAAEGRSSVMVLAGPLGIGRSALLQELPRCADEGTVHVLRAGAAPTEQGLAHGVVRQLFDSLLTTASGPVRKRLLAGAGAARQVLGDDLVPGPDASDGTVLRDLRGLLATLSAAAPLLVLIDDLQWTDPRSLSWLARLARRLDGLRLLLVCTLRDGDPGSRDPLVQELVSASARVLRPKPLSPAATGQLVRAHLGEPADEDFVHACHELSRGCPLFLRSVLSEAALTGCPPVAASTGLLHTAHPAQLRDRLVNCLLLQPQPVRDAAAAIATLAGHEDPALLGRLAGLDDVGLTTALRVLRQLGLTAEEDETRFAHPSVREAVECSMSAAERQRWQETAAVVLYDSGLPAEQVAAQLMEVPTPGYAWAVPVLRSAADSVRRKGRPELAARYLRRALLETVAQDRTRAQLLVELAAVELSFDPPAAESHVAQALPLLPTARDRAAAVLRLSPCVTSPVTPSGAALLRRAVDDLVDPCVRDDSGGEEALGLEARLRYAGLDDYAQLADAVARLRVLEPPVRSRGGRELLAVLLHAATLSADGEASEVVRRARTVLDWEPATIVGGGSVMQLVLFSLVGADALQAAESWQNAAERGGHGDDGADAMTHARRALFHIARGRLPQAREQAEHIVELAGTIREESRCFVYGVLGALALSTRDMQLSSRIVGDAADRCLGPIPSALLGLLRMAEQAQEGDAEAALETAMECGRQLECAGWRNPVLFPWRPWAVSLSHQLGDHHLARTLAAEEYARAREWGAPVAIGRALRLRARTDGADERVDLLREAVGTLRESANQLELFMAVRDLGRQLGDGAEARESLREAGELAESCGVPWLPGPVTGEGRPSAPAVRTALTRTETRVASLVVNGLTNQEIAAELQVSARAVEKHLTNSYRKLGITGRRELAAVVQESGVHAPG
ncbi:ATP-binding protein [Streptomyces sp. NPDC088337]|uniref:ATP-binding protein n=1 Tax=unclassified Streptomyces TaxID=2593676 RepID=UPI002DD953DA|nr:AAA family ATPase [Streptomyces sp. NBC_01788]WSB25128.1 AAA family ATPase [Streptomyces sp. NBC_01788]